MHEADKVPAEQNRADKDHSLDAAAALLEGARAPEDVFGALGGSADEQLKVLAATFRRLARAVHPDRYCGAATEGRAKALFQEMTSWRDAAERKIGEGTYGDGRTASSTPPTPPTPWVIQTRRRTFILKERIATGDLADVYDAVMRDDDSAGGDGGDAGGASGSPTRPCVLKVARSPADNDLMENEARVAAALYPAAQPEERTYRSFAKPLDSFVLRSGGGVHRRINVFARADGFISLAEVLRAHPRGIAVQDLAWIFKRLLVAVGFAHERGVVHGAVVPANVLVHPVSHGGKLVDWCYAVKAGGTLRAISAPCRSFYPPEVLAKKPASSHTDIFLATKTAVALLGGDVSTNAMPARVPASLQAFLRGCLLPSQRARPDDAWALHDEFKEVMARVIGERRYRPLPMPAR